MATAFEIGGEELVHYLRGHIGINETTGHHEDVGIVVLADEMGNLWNPTQTGSDGLVLVERHVDAFAGAADGDAGIDLAGFDAARQGVAEVAVVARVLAVGAVVLPCNTALIEVLFDELFEGIASVIGS